MRVLQATIQPPDLHSGGGLGVYQSAASLVGNDLIYLGPKPKDAGLEQMYSAARYLDLGRSKAAKAISFVTTGLFHDWRSTTTVIRNENPDCAYLDFTWAYPFAEAVKRCDIPLVVRAHNVEADYADRQYEKSRTLRNAISKMHARSCELRVLKCADALICLTEHDKQRFIDLYEYEVPNLGQKIRLNPVAIQGNDARSLTKTTLGKIPTLLITGSLWYRPNADGVVWFIREVWPKIGNRLRLIVAGSKPTDEVKAACAADERITLVESPASMEPFFHEADFFVAPVFDGAGMKVKVAEALSYGMPVVATRHALIGYVEGADCLRKADTPDQMTYQIDWLMNQDYSRLRSNALEVFRAHYSMQSSRQRVQQIISEVCDA